MGLRATLEEVVDCIAALLQGVVAILIAAVILIGAFYLAAKAWSSLMGALP